MYINRRENVDRSFERNYQIDLLNPDQTCMMKKLKNCSSNTFHQI